MVVMIFLLNSYRIEAFPCLLPIPFLFELERLEWAAKDTLYFFFFDNFDFIKEENDFLRLLIDFIDDEEGDDEDGLEPTDFPFLEETENTLFPETSNN
jgi:hypothetical protein